MAEVLKVRKVGDTLGVLFPDAAVDELDVNEGDKWFIIHTSEGVRLAPFDPETAEVVEDARTFMHTHQNAFRELA